MEHLYYDMISNFRYYMELLRPLHHMPSFDERIHRLEDQRANLDELSRSLDDEIKHLALVEEDAFWAANENFKINDKRMDMDTEERAVKYKKETEKLLERTRKVRDRVDLIPGKVQELEMLNERILSLFLGDLEEDRARWMEWKD